MNTDPPITEVSTKRAMQLLELREKLLPKGNKLKKWRPNAGPQQVGQWIQWHYPQHYARILEKIAEGKRAKQSSKPDA